MEGRLYVAAMYCLVKNVNKVAVAPNHSPEETTSNHRRRQGGDINANEIRKTKIVLGYS